MKTEAETGWTNMPGDPKAGRDRKDLSLEPPEGAPGCRYLGFRPLQNSERAQFCWFGVFCYGSCKTLMHLGPDCLHL